MKVNWPKAILAGIIGTLLFDITGFLFTGTWWDIPRVLSDAINIPLPVAVFMHYGNGVALAAIYAAMAPSLLGPGWLRALFFTTLETLMLVWFLLFPLLGLGIAGLEGGVIFPVLSMVRHWLYAIPLAYFFPVSCEEESASESSKGCAEIAAC